MKNRYVLIILIVLAVFAAFLLKKCAAGRAGAGIQKKSAAVSPESVLPGKSFKKFLKEKSGPGIKDCDILVIRTDPLGKIKWHKTYGTPGYDWADFAIQSEDGGFLVLGRTYSSEDNIDDYNMMKIDASGNTLWSKRISGRGSESADPVAQAVDGGYIITGKSFSDDSGEKEVFLAKTDRDGNYEWVHNFGREYYDWGYSALIEKEGSYIVSGQEDAPDEESDVLLKNMGNDGKPVWERSYGGKSYDRGYSIAPCAEGFMIAGLTYSFGSGNDDAYLVKISKNGEKIWDKAYGGSGFDEAFSICEGDKTGFVLAGATSSWGSGGHDVFMMKVDAEGNSLWSAVYGGAGDDAAYSINRLKDGGYIIAGASNSVWQDK